MPRKSCHFCVVTVLAVTGAAAAAPIVGFPAAVDLADTNGIFGLRLEGLTTNDNVGRRVAGLGDINGDKIADIITCSPYATSDAGQCYVLFGRKPTIDNPFPTALQVDDLDGTNGFVINGFEDGDASGLGLAGAGDVNGDGMNDIFIGAPYSTPDGSNATGGAYVVFGRKTTPFPASINLGDLDGTNGFTIAGIDLNDVCGVSIAGAGDFNGDKIADLIIASSNAQPAGEAYIVFGRKAPTTFPALLDLADLDGVNGFRIDGISGEDDFAYAVAAAGDFNADKIADVLIGASDTNNATGACFLLFGRKAPANNPFPAFINVADLDGTNGFVINGIDEGDYFGNAIAPAGDINGDKIADIIVGAPRADPGAVDAGETYVIFGRKPTASTPFAATLSVATLDGTNGFRINGVAADDGSGRAVASAGDFNNDKVGDIFIGANDVDNNRGAAYVVFGRKTTADNPFPASIDLADLNGVIGVRFDGGGDSDLTGQFVASAGDFNGDKITDLIIGEPGASPGAQEDAGQATIIFGPTPEIDVASAFGPTALDLSSIPDGSSVNLGALDVGVASEFTFNLRNRSIAHLNVDNYKVPRGFSVVSQPGTTFTALSSSDLIITTTPTRTGSFTGKLSFRTDDPDEKKYDITLNWSVPPGLAAAQSTHVINVDSIIDLNNDWVTNAADVALMLRAISNGDTAADLNDDNQVNTDDLVILLTRFEHLEERPAR